MSTLKLSCSGHTRREKAGSLEDGDAEENERRPGKETARSRADFVKEAGGRSTGLRAGRGGCDPFTGVGADASARNARSSESRPTFGRIRKTGGCPALPDHTRHEALGGGRLMAERPKDSRPTRSGRNAAGFDADGPTRQDGFTAAKPRVSRALIKIETLFC